MKSVCLGSKKRATNKDEQTWLRVTNLTKVRAANQTVLRHSKCWSLISIQLLIKLLRLSKWHFKTFRRSRRLLFSTQKNRKRENQETYESTFNISSPNNFSWKREIYFYHSTYRNHPQVLFSFPKKQRKDCGSNGTECGWLAQTHQISMDSSQDMPQQLHCWTCDEKGFQMVGKWLGLIVEVSPSKYMENLIKLRMDRNKLHSALLYKIKNRFLQNMRVSKLQCW